MFSYWTPKWTGFHMCSDLCIKHPISWFTFISQWTIFFYTSSYTIDLSRFGPHQGETRVSRHTSLSLVWTGGSSLSSGVLVIGLVPVSTPNLSVFGVSTYPLSLTDQLRWETVESSPRKPAYVKQYLTKDSEYRQTQILLSVLKWWKKGGTTKRRLSLRKNS